MKTTFGLIFARGWMSFCSFFSFILVGRFLTPQDFGIFALASSAALLPHLLVGAGFYEFVLVRQTVAANRGTAETCALFSGIAAGLTILAFAVIAERGFGNRDAALLLVFFAISSVLWGASCIKEALLIRENRGGTVLAVLWLSETAGLIALIVSLAMGAGIFALAYARIVNAAIVATGFAIASGKPFSYSFKLPLAVEMLRFGAGIMGSRLVNWTYAYGNDLVIGNIMPAAGVGIFRMGVRLHAAAQSVLIDAPAAATLTSLGATTKHGPGRMAVRALRILRLQAAVATPIFIAFGITASVMVDLVLGSQWVQSGSIIIILCFSTPLLVTSVVAQSVLLAEGQSYRLMIYQFVMMAPLILALTLSAYGGPLWAALAKVAVSCVYAIGVVALLNAIKPSARAQILKTALLITAAAIAMGGFCFVFIDWIKGFNGPVFRLFLLGLAVLGGLAVYAAVLQILDRKSIRLIWAAVRFAKQKLYKRKKSRGAKNAHELDKRPR